MWPLAELTFSGWQITVTPPILAGLHPNPDCHDLQPACSPRVGYADLPSSFGRNLWIKKYDEQKQQHYDRIAG